MTIFRFSLGIWLMACPALAQETAPPARPLYLSSGLTATALELLWEPQVAPAEMWVRARFVVPELADKVADFEAIGADLVQLCREQVLPAIRADGRGADLAVISMSAEAIEFGETRPDVLQVFESFRLETGDCISEEF